MSKKFNELKSPEMEAIAHQGKGVFETLKVISKMVLANIRGGLN